MWVVLCASDGRLGLKVGVLGCLGGARAEGRACPSQDVLLVHSPVLQALC